MRIINPDADCGDQAATLARFRCWQMGQGHGHLKMRGFVGRLSHNYRPYIPAQLYCVASSGPHPRIRSRHQLTDWHISSGLDPGRQLNPAWKIGMVGYLMEQVTGDSGSGATLGPDKASVGASGDILLRGKRNATQRSREMDTRDRCQEYVPRRHGFRPHSASNSEMTRRTERPSR
jgi:hypothetical protein